MKTSNRNRSSDQQGVAAIEFLLVMPVIILVLALTVFFGRIFWHYTVAVKAASDVATFMALSRNSEMLDVQPDYSEIGIAKFARSIGETEVAELNPGKGAKPIIDISCDGFPCRGESAPNEIGVSVKMRMYSPYLPQVLSQLGNMEGMWLKAEVRVRYAGA